MSEKREAKLSVRRDIQRPPKGWTYTVPQTGFKITGGYFHEVWDTLLKHVSANNLPMPSREEVEDASCRESKPPGSWCAAVAKPIAPLPIGHLMLHHVEQFLRTVWQALMDRKFVPRGEAERRLDTCLKCPLRTTSPKGCMGCFTLVRKANMLLAKNDAIVIEPDEDGFVRDTCGACGCLLPLKVFLQNDTLNTAEGHSRPAYWEGCWRNDS